MRLSLIALILVLFTVCSHSSRDRNDKPYKVVCYWGSWSFYRNGPGKACPLSRARVWTDNYLLNKYAINQFRAEDSNPNLCTHMNYGFAKLNANNTIGIFDPDLDLGDTDWKTGLAWGEGMYRRWNHLRTVNPHLTTLLSVGGWNEGSDKYSRMAASASSRAAFVESVVRLLKEHDFDGLDLDWEYPTMKAKSEEDREPGVMADKQNYVLLLKELHSAFAPHGFLLTAAVSPGKPTIDRAYDVPQLSRYLDIINLMSYDFHVGKENKTAHHSPLHPRPDDSELNKEFTVEYAVNYWLKLGVDPKKLVLGMPLYGRSFTLSNPTAFGIGAPTVSDGGKEGTLTHLIGMLGYNEICQDLKSDQWKVYRDETQKIPYAVNQGLREWVGYDDEISLKAKTDFLKAKGLGGVMVWTIDTDDFRGLCGKGKYPLLKTLSRELNHVDGPDVDIPETHVTPLPTQTPGTGKPTQRPTQRPDGPFQCWTTGYFADNKDQTIFHDCISDGNGGLRDLVNHCPPGTTFKEEIRVCT